jgi:hypothetical protein
VLFCRELNGANYATDVIGGLLHARNVAAAVGAWPICLNRRARLTPAGQRNLKSGGKG